MVCMGGLSVNLNSANSISTGDHSVEKGNPFYSVSMVNVRAVETF